ncbi:MAG: hypothetical protein AB1390_05770 [Nitrospirota bacterium]
MNNRDTTLSPIGELFVKSWHVFKKRMVTLLFLYLISLILFGIAFAVFLGTGYLFAILFPDVRQAIIAGGAFIGCIAGFIAMFWGLGSFISAVSDDTLGFKDALERGSQRIGSFIWLFILLGFIITGGFLLFIVPGIIFTVWFMFSQFILASENEKGMNALLKSKEYVRGFWFDVFLRLFLIWLISLVIGFIPVAGPILSIFFIPFMMVFSFLVYQDLRILKSDIAFRPSGGKKMKWIGTALLGYMILPLVFLIYFGAYIAARLNL